MINDYIQVRLLFPVRAGYCTCSGRHGHFELMEQPQTVCQGIPVWWWYRRAGRGLAVASNFGYCLQREPGRCGAWIGVHSASIS